MSLLETMSALPRTFSFDVCREGGREGARPFAAGDRPAAIRHCKFYRKLRCRQRQGKSNTDTRPTPGCHRPSARATSAPGKYPPYRIAGSLRAVHELILAATGKPKWKSRSTGNDHEPWMNLGSSSDDARRSIAAHCSGWQASLRLLHGAPACHHGWRSLLGVESVQGRPASLDVGICRGCASFEPVLADTYAAGTVATD